MKNPGTPSRFEPEPAGVGEADYDRIRNAIEATRAPSLRTHVRIAVALVVVPVLCAAAVWTLARILGRPAVRIDLASGSTSHLFADLALLVALTLVVSFVAVRRGRQGFGSSVVSLVAIAALLAPAYAALSLGGPLDSHAADAGLSPWGTPCIVVATVVGALSLTSFAFALRRAVPVAGVIRGAALGAASGAWAGLSIFVFCPAENPQHILVGHVLPVLAFAVIGAVSLPRALRP